MPRRQGGFGVSSSRPSVVRRFPGRLITSAAASAPATKTTVIRAARTASSFIPLPCMGGGKYGAGPRRGDLAGIRGWKLETVVAMPPDPALDPIPVFDVRLEEAHVEAVAETLRSGWLTMGPRIEELEAEFAAHLGTPHAIA